jgi:hypothetical protein
MSRSPDESLDRWLRFAPWAAAILAALCLIVLVARVALRATGELQHTADATSHATNAPSSKSSGSTPANGGRSTQKTDGPSSPTNSTTPQDASNVVAPPKPTSADRGPASRINRPASDVATPNSKSRFEIHGAAESASADSRPVTALPTRISDLSAFPGLNPRLDPKRPAAAATDQSSEVLLRRFNRLPDAHGLAQTSFFGLEAAGRRFVYVLDRSGSMGEPGNKPLRAAKDELVKSLDRLGGLHQFVLIFYNQEPSVFAGDAPGRLPFGTDIEKAQARNFVEAISAQGGTDHFNALAKAVKLNPDVIFLLTDGEQKDDLTAEELADIQRMNRSVARIYVVQFASAPYASNSLVRLAEENRGQHTYLDIRKPQ